MNSLELIASLRRQTVSISNLDEIRPAADSSHIQYAHRSIEYASSTMRQYNYAAFLEITDPETTVFAREIDNDAIAALESMLDGYMDTFAPDQPDLKKYIKLVSLYLAFVARRPLHPPSIVAPESNSSAATINSRYCVVGEADLDERFPICRYCVAYSNHSGPGEGSMK
jgi:uncharacterized protein (UPF0305 family)